MKKKENCRKTRVLLLVILLMLSFAMSACAGDGEDDGKFTVRDGVTKFSFEYPPTYLKPYVRDSTQDSTHIFAAIRQSKKGQRDSDISISVFKANEYYQDYRAWLEKISSGVEQA